MEQFIKNHPDKTKHLLLTHMSEILKAVTLNYQCDAFELFKQPNFSLTRIPHLQHEFFRDRTLNRQKKIVTFDQVEELYGQHSCNLVNHFSCRFIVQCLLGVRVSNTFNLANASIKEKVCLKCKEFSACKIIKSDCFKRFVIHESDTKTGQAYEMPILPQIFSCINTLVKFDRLNKPKKEVMESFNKNFMMPKFQCTSHSNRAVLPNLQAALQIYDNTGCWKDLTVMRKHYLSGDAKFLLAYSLLPSVVA